MERLDDVAAALEVDTSRLELEGLLDAFLDRVVAALQVDTAAVLLADRENRFLIARAARGLEEEVRQGVRVPIGRGFAGRIAAERRPVVLDRIDATTVENPILWTRGIRSMLGVPLLDAGRLLGVLHVGVLSDREFTPEDADLLQVVAERCSRAVVIHRDAAERAAAQLLERSLLPGELPATGEMTFASRFVPAIDGAVGGDWYDAFELPNGDLWMIVGDVAGHGLEAAIVMGRLRSTLRAYVLEGHSPVEVLRLADEKLRFFEPGAMATLLCGRIRPPCDEVEFVSAGHLPPVLASPDAGAQLIELAPSRPLGIGGGSGASTAHVALPPGTVVVMYTDGLVERPGEVLDEGLGRLVTAARATEPEIVCREVMGELVNRSVPRDDIALIVSRRIGGLAAA